MPLLYIHYTRHDLVICTFLHRWLTSPQRALLALFKHATSFISILRRRSASSGEAFWSFPKLLALISHQDASLLNCIPSGQVAKKKNEQKNIQALDGDVRWRNEGAVYRTWSSIHVHVYTTLSVARQKKKKGRKLQKNIVEAAAPLFTYCIWTKAK